jgi:hypothetical protein
MVGRNPSLLVLFGLIASLSTQAAPTTLDPDGGLRLNGKRWFPLGMYAIPKDASGFQRISKAGFNLVRSGPTKENLDQIQQAGLQAWIPLGGHSELRDATQAAQLDALISPLKDHPALAIWELPDEALWNVNYAVQEAFWAERGQILPAIREQEAAGKDVSALKNLYRELVASEAVGDPQGMEGKLAELKKQVFPPEKTFPPRRLLTASLEEQKALYQRLLNGYQTLRRVDPNHLVWQNHAPRNSIDLLARHADYCDLIGCDIYPYPSGYTTGHSDLANRNLSSVGDYTDRFRRLAPDKGVLMVLQGFGWRNLNPVQEAFNETEMGKPPRYLASRFMAYDAIVRGANGICYWGTEYPDEQDTAFRGLAPVVRELASLHDFLAEPVSPLPLAIEQTPSWSSLDRGVLCSARRLGNDWLLIFVNELDGPQTVQVEFPTVLVGKRLNFLYENLYCEPVAETYLPMSFAAYGVRILSTRQDLEVKDLRAYNRIFEDPFPGK